MMDMKPVSSSNIAQIGYDEGEKKLTVVFHSGATWTFVDVEKDIYDSLMSAESVGRTFNSLVRGQYDGSQE